MAVDYRTFQDGNIALPKANGDIDEDLEFATPDVDVTKNGVFSIAVNPTNGTASISGTNIVFVPATNFLGTAIIGYTITDGIGGTNTALVTVTVTTSCPPPVVFCSPPQAARTVRSADRCSWTQTSTSGWRRSAGSSGANRRTSWRGWPSRFGRKPGNPAMTSASVGCSARVSCWRASLVMSMWTGPGRPVRAIWNASATTRGRSSASRTR